MAITQNKTNKTPDCLITVSSIAGVGDVVGFQFSSINTGGTPVTYDNVWVTSADNTAQLITDLFNADQATHKCQATVRNGSSIEIIVLDFNGNDEFVIEVDYNTESFMVIEYFLPAPYAWCDDESKRLEPVLEKQTLGWIANEKPALQWWNYMLNTSANMSSYLYGLGTSLKQTISDLEDQLNTNTGNIGDNTTNIGDLNYTEKNYVVDSEPLTASVDSLDVQLKDTDDKSNTNATNIGTVTYTEQNYVDNGEPLTVSIDALDRQLKDTDDKVNLSAPADSITYRDTSTKGNAGTSQNETVGITPANYDKVPIGVTYTLLQSNGSPLTTSQTYNAVWWNFQSQSVLEFRLVESLTNYSIEVNVIYLP